MTSWDTEMHFERIASICRYSIVPTPRYLEAHWQCQAFPDGIPRDWPCHCNLTGTLAVKPCKVPQKCPNGCRFELTEEGRDILIYQREWDYPDGNVDKVDGGETKEQFERRLRSYVPPFK